MPGTNRTYTGRIISLRHERYPYRKRPLAKGKMKVDARLFKRKVYFETYDDPENPLEKRDRIKFNLDINGKPINIQKI